MAKTATINTTYRVGIYGRCSSNPYGDKQSPETQHERGIAWCEADDERVFMWSLFDDDISGARFDRPKLIEVLERAHRHEFDILVITELTRLGRSLEHMLQVIRELSDCGVEIVSLKESFDTSTAAGKMQLQILLVLAEFERNRASERACENHAYRARHGKPYAGPAHWGYAYTEPSKSETALRGGSGPLVIVPHEAEAVRMVYDLYLSNHGYAKTLKILKEKGITGPRGGMLTRSSISRVLRDPMYCNLRIYRGQETYYDPPIPIIIEEAKWRAVQAKLAKRDTRASARGTFPLTRLLVCATCGKSLQRVKPFDKWAKAQREQGIDVADYRCPDGHVSMRESTIEAEAWRALSKRLDKMKIEQMALKVRKKRNTKRVDRESELEIGLVDIEGRRHRLLALVEKGINPDDLKGRLDQIRTEEDRLKASLEELRAAERAEEAGANTRIRAEELLATWDHLKPEDKREIFGLFTDGVIIHPVGRKRQKETAQSKRVQIVWKESAFS